MIYVTLPHDQYKKVISLMNRWIIELKLLQQQDRMTWNQNVELTILLRLDGDLRGMNFSKADANISFSLTQLELTILNYYLSSENIVFLSFRSLYT